MKLSAIRLRNVKSFGPEGIAVEAIPDGLSVLAQPNEFGKSTLFEAVRLMLQQKHSGSSATIKAFAPWANSGPPEIELDIEIPSGRFRVYKRFLQKKAAQVLDLGSGDVLAQGSEADAWLADVAGMANGASGPTGLLWVQQGRSMAQPEGGEAVLSHLLEREVGTLVGGERARDYLERAKQDLDALITTKKREPKGPYKDALAALEQATETEKELLERQQKADYATRELVRIDAEMTDLSDADEGKRLAEQCAAAQAKLETAKEARHALTVLEERRDRAADTVSGAIADRDRFEAEVADAARLSEAAADAEKQKAELSEQCEALKDALDTASEKFTAADTAVKDASVHNRERDALLEALRAFEAAEGLEARLEDARLLEDAMRVRAETIRKNPVTQAKYDAVSELEKAVAVAEAQLEAGRPKISFALEGDGPDFVTLNGEAVPAGHKQSLTGVNTVSLGAAGTVTISAIDPEDAAIRLENAVSARDTALTDLGVSDVAAAEKRAKTRHTDQLAQEQARQRLAILAPDGVATLESDLAQHRALVPYDFDPEAFAGAAVDVAPLEAERDAAGAGVDELRKRLAEIQQDLVKQQTLAKTHGDGLARLTAQLGHTKDRERKAKTLEAAVKSAEAQYQALLGEIETAQQSAPDLDMATAEVDRFSSVIENRKTALQDLNIERARLNAEIEAVGAEGVGERLDEQRAEIVLQKGRIAQFEADIRALDCLIKALQTAQDELQAAYFKPVTDALEPLIRAVIGEGTLRLGANFQADSLRRGAFNETIDTLSGGTREQIAVLSRLAFGRLMAERGTPVPVFLDDALVYCDDDRLGAMFTAMNVAAKDIQCIVLTCHKRAFSDLGGANLVPRQWREQD